MNKNGQLSPSMMCAEIDKLTDYLRTFKEKQIEYLHIDVMDGTFVPNITLGTDYAKQLRKMTDIPLDFHLMVVKPEDKIPWFEPQEGEYVSFHIESTENPSRCIELIKERGAKAMIAINPETELSCVYPYLDRLDGVLLMMVHPGFAGQRIVKEAIEKVQPLKAKLKELGLDDKIEIEVDGNLTLENTQILFDKGADIFVAGTSSVFKKDCDIRNTIDQNRRILGVKQPQIKL